MNPILKDRIEQTLVQRKAQGLERTLCLYQKRADHLNFADNNYLSLADDPRLKRAAQAAIEQWGCSASASPLITGYQPLHQQLEKCVCDWCNFPHALIWNTGYAANAAVLSTLPQKGDIVLADRLIHNSMITGILHSGARLTRYRHRDLEQLERLLTPYSQEARLVFVVTETVFSMDGDYPDLKQMAALKKTYDFIWIVDEAHAIGWYGEKGSGLIEATEVSQQVDVGVGTLGKALGSMGAFTVFQTPALRHFLLNHTGEWIYSTYLAPACAAAACEAITIVRHYAQQRPQWQAQARSFRLRLQTLGLQVPSGDSPIIPILIGDSRQTVAIAQRLKQEGILVAAIRPPTVPAQQSRLRLSIKAPFPPATQERILDALQRALKETS